LTFCDRITKENEYDIPFVLANNSTSIKWLKLLYDDIYITKCDWSNNRFVGFDDPTETSNRFKNEMNEIIDICEKERPGHFNIKITNDMTQNDFNKIHTWFEVYRGELYKPHKFFLEGSDKFKYAIERFNQLIHMWEKIDHFEKTNSAMLTVDILGPQHIIELEDEDYNNFEFMKYPNTIQLAFISRGKNLINFWRDGDEHIGEHNIGPYKYLGSTFSLVAKENGWDTETLNYEKNSFNNWFDRKSNYLNSLGFYKDDPRSCIGWLPLAHSLIPNIKEIIQPRQYLKNIKIFEEVNDY